MNKKPVSLNEDRTVAPLLVDIALISFLHRCKSDFYINSNAMTTTPEHDARIANMIFASVYPHYVDRIVRNGRTEEELHQVIEWLTGINAKKLQQLLDEKVTFEAFFAQAKLNPNAHLIKG